MEIREAIDADDPAMLALWNEGEPEPMTIELWRQSAETRGPEAFPLQCVGVDVQQIVALGIVMRAPSAPPEWATVVVKVGGEHRRQGRGEQVWAHVAGHPAAKDAPVLSVNVRDDDPESRAWAERRGFALWAHRFQSFLDLEAFDDEAFDAVIAKVERDGIRLTTLADLGTGAEIADRLFELYSRLVLSMPDNDQGVQPTRESYERFYLDPSQHPPHATIVALDGDRPIAMTAVQPRRPGFVYTSLSGVDEEYRGRGIGVAVKARSVPAARALGATRMGTNNLSINAPILAINHRMGYVRQPGLWLLRRHR